MKDLVCVVLTSHCLDCFWLCLRSLDRHTDLSRFKRIYILANEVAPEHKVVIDAFASRHRQVTVMHCSPRGLHGCVISMRNAVLGLHSEDMVVKLDEDVFVRPGWLDGMLNAYERHREDGVSLVSALVPNNQIGRTMMHDFLSRR